MKCAICKLEIREGQKITQCPYCMAIFHEEHYLDWLKEDPICPVCSVELIDQKQQHNNSQHKIELIPSNMSISYDKFNSSNELFEMKKYNYLRLDELPEKVIYQFIKSNANFDYFLNKEAKVGYILKKEDYYAYSLYKSIIGMLFILATFASVLALFLSFFTLAVEIPSYKAIAFVCISMCCFITLSIFYAKSFQGYSKKWMAIEFTDYQISIIYSEKSSYYNRIVKNIPISKIIEFEFGKANGYRNGRIIIYLTLLMEDNTRFNLGEIFYDKKLKAFNFKANLIRFLIANYKTPITNTDERSIKKRNFALLGVILLIITYVVFTIVTLILSIQSLSI
ncbi:MAG: hypothetical protein FK734_08230 [Asgard group archaeon]|nr:hypothetical protein [Asgard group archaeon]